MKRFALLCVLAFATACGTGSPAVDAGGKLKDLKIAPTTPASGSAQPGEDPAREIAMLRSRMGEVWARNTNLRADVTLYVKDVPSGKTESAKIDYWFQKPNSTALLIKEHTKAAAAGTKFVWMGGSKVAIKTKFIGFWVKTSLDEKDERLLDARGDSLSDTAVPKMMQTLLDPQAQVGFVGRGEYKGRPVVQIALRSKYMVKGVESERIAIDTGSFLPVVREMYQRGQLTYRLQLEGIKINVREPDAFKLD